MKGVETSNEPAEHNIEMLVSRVLRVGVYTSSAVVLLGGIAYLYLHGGERADYATFHGAPESDRSITRIFTSTLAHPSRTVIEFGILLLILTPVARVAIALFGFAKARDRTYAVISGIVLVVLMFGLFWGPARG